MIENYRSQLLWNLFMADSEIQAALTEIGFVPDITNLNDEKKTDLDFRLLGNYPNPFNPVTIISFTIPKSEIINLKVYDVLGNEVATLINEEKPAGEYETNFDASSLASGVYYYKLKAGDFVKTKKMVFLK